MIKNKELFQRDPTTTKLLNDGVAAVKDAVTEQERETLRYELSHFVCEGQYKDGIVRILESYIANIGSASQLAAWIARARSSLVASFASGVAKDEAAVRAAISLPWSNGQTEGHITKLKLVKRQMYGRAKIDLLQARLIGAI